MQWLSAVIMKPQPRRLTGRISLLTHLLNIGMGLRGRTLANAVGSLADTVIRNDSAQHAGIWYALPYIVLVSAIVMPCVDVTAANKAASKMPGAAEVQGGNGIVNHDGTVADATTESGDTHATK
jgi:hypothetical protein